MNGSLFTPIGAQYPLMGRVLSLAFSLSCLIYAGITIWGWPGYRWLVVGVAGLGVEVIWLSMRLLVEAVVDAILDRIRETEKSSHAHD